MRYQKEQQLQLRDIPHWRHWNSLKQLTKLPVLTLCVIFSVFCPLISVIMSTIICHNKIHIGIILRPGKLWNVIWEVKGKNKLECSGRAETKWKEDGDFTKDGVKINHTGAWRDYPDSVEYCQVYSKYEKTWKQDNWGQNRNRKGGCIYVGLRCRMQLLN